MRPGLFCSVLLIVLGCKKQDAPDVAGVDAGMPAGPAVVERPDVPTDPRLVMTSLQKEARNRSARGLRVEDVLEALREGGIAVTGDKQVLAATVKASYCRMAQSAGALSLSICEYPDAAAATAGRAYSQKAFPNVTNRSIAARHNVTLTVFGGTGDPSRTPEGQRVFAVFSSLEQKPLSAPHAGDQRDGG